MGAEIKQKQEDGLISAASCTNLLLELAAMDDLDSFKVAVELSGLPIDGPGLWYTRQIGSKSNKMSYELRTPLMVAAQYGSTSVLDYILQSGLSDVNRVSGSDRVTALHCAVAGGSESTPAVVDRLIAASADPDSRAADLILSFPKFKKHQRLHLETKLVSKPLQFQHQQQEQQPGLGSGSGSPVLPDINNGVYSTDEFRMYCFKIVPCSRAYTHDWTECPFAHPGENAKRRDPKKHPYTCVPCPEFKKGACKKGDDCEFAHGVFESWLHPAQYRTRLCKDETGCSRKVCFFAHKKEDLRPVYHSTGSAIPGPEISTPPMSPSFSPKGSAYSPMASMSMSMSMGVPPPSLQLPGSRLRTSLSARDQHFLQQHQQQQQHILSSRVSDLSPTNLETVFNAINHVGVGRKVSPPRGLDSSPKSMAAAMLNSRAAAFAKRSQSFIDRAATMPGNMSDWGSPNGKLEWGVKGDELQKLRKSNSFGFRGGVDGVALARTTSPPGFNEPDVSWVNSLVNNEAGPRFFVNGGAGKQEMRSPWVDQLYIDQHDQLVA